MDCLGHQSRRVNIADRDRMTRTIQTHRWLFFIWICSSSFKRLSSQSWECRRREICSRVTLFSAQKWGFFHTYHDVLTEPLLDFRRCHCSQWHWRVTTSFSGVTVIENSDIGTNVVTISATDLDFGVSGDIQFSMNASNILANQYFQIGASNGQISVKAPIDREEIPSVRCSQNRCVTSVCMWTYVYFPVSTWSLKIKVRLVKVVRRWL